MPRVASAIQDSYGEPEKLQRAMSVEYRFGGCNFIFQNEWNDPCLISECATGDDVLRRLFAGLTAKN